MHVIRSRLRQEDTNMAKTRLDHVSRLGYRGNQPQEQQPQQPQTV